MNLAGFPRRRYTAGPTPIEFLRRFTAMKSWKRFGRPPTTSSIGIISFFGIDSQEYLVLFGIDPSRLQAKGYGESMPVAPNDTEENKAKNRRVELVRPAR